MFAIASMQLFPGTGVVGRVERVGVFLGRKLPLPGDRSIVEPSRKALMKNYTVAECDVQAQRELGLAKIAGETEVRNRHLNRAAIFAYCSENARNDAARNGITLCSELPCCPDL